MAVRVKESEAPGVSVLEFSVKVTYDKPLGSFCAKELRDDEDRTTAESLTDHTHIAAAGRFT